MSTSNKIELYSPKFFGYCAVGGLLSCGITHTLVTPVDLVKCRMQVGYPYKNTLDGIKNVVGEGIGTTFRGWAPTAVGYSIQGICKFGFYELFKKKFSDFAGVENAEKYKTLIFMAGSASAELIADAAFCPFEAVKVRVQTSTEDKATAPKGLRDGMSRIIQNEGVGGLYKGLVPLWMRQVPYTIMKFTAFERVVETIYKYALAHPKEHYNKTEQLGVTFVAGYIAGIFCAVVSHPADVVVSKLNKSSDKTAGQIVKELGFKGCWSGLAPRIFMIGTLTALQWFIYDTFKVSVGLPTSGAKNPAATPAPKKEE